MKVVQSYTFFYAHKYINDNAPRRPPQIILFDNRHGRSLYRHSSNPKPNLNPNPHPHHLWYNLLLYCSVHSRRFPGLHALQHNRIIGVFALHRVHFALRGYCGASNVFILSICLFLSTAIQVLWVYEERCILNERTSSSTSTQTPSQFGYGKELNVYMILLTILFSMKIGYSYK